MNLLLGRGIGGGPVRRKRLLVGGTEGCCVSPFRVGAGPHLPLLALGAWGAAAPCGCSASSASRAGAPSRTLPPARTPPSAVFPVWRSTSSAAFTTPSPTIVARTSRPASTPWNRHVGRAASPTSGSLASPSSTATMPPASAVRPPVTAIWRRSSTAGRRHPAGLLGARPARTALGAVSPWTHRCWARSPSRPIHTARRARPDGRPRVTRASVPTRALRG